MRAPIFKINPLHPEEDKIRTISKILLNGGLLIIPTDTVYGVAADKRNQKAVSRLYQIKQRSKDKPFSILIDNKENIEDFASGIDKLGYKLIDRFWPGPLTLILKALDKQGSVGLRMPDNKICLSLIAAVGGPLYCPSANLPGRPAPLDLDEAMKDLGDKVDGAIDGGKARLGIESTVLDLTNKSYRIQRQGALSKEAIEKLAQTRIVLFVCTGNSCRSVMAKAFLEKRLEQENRNNIEVISAGILGIPNLGVSPETEEVLRKEAIIVEGHISRQVTSIMIKKSDMVLVMEKRHEERILEMVPEAKTKVFLLKEFANMQDSFLDIEDPIGRPVVFHEYTFSIIKEAINRIVKIL